MEHVFVVRIPMVYEAGIELLFDGPPTGADPYYVR